MPWAAPAGSSHLPAMLIREGFQANVVTGCLMLQALGVKVYIKHVALKRGLAGGTGYNLVVILSQLMFIMIPCCVPAAGSLPHAALCRLK